MSDSPDEAAPREDILIVDDTPTTLRLLMDILSRAGYAVRPASDGELALRSARVQPPALILLDVRMPGLNGYEVCQRLKADPLTEPIPVLFLSGLGEEGDKVRAFQVGGVDYLTKPFQTEEVLVRVRTHLALRRVQSDLKRRNAELQAASASLEDRVCQRTAELQRETDEHRQTTEALAQSEERFRLMAETVPDILFTSQPDGRVDYINSRFYQYTGLPAGAGLGASWSEVLPPDERTQVLGLVQQVTQTGEPLQYECQVRSQAGEYRWFVIRSRPIRDEAGQIVKWYGTATDIHDLKLAQEEQKRWNDILEQRVLERTALAEHRASQLRLLAAELSQAEERERHRIARVLHDQLQQILVAARMKARLLAGPLSAERTRSLSDEMDRLLTQALEESRTLTASLSPPILYDRGLVAGLQWLTRHAREHWELSVTLQARHEAEPSEQSHRVFLFQTVRELLLNVAKHAHTPEAQIELSSLDGAGTRLVVADRGVGFDPNQAEHPNSPGGFGLFSIRERLALLGGRMQIDSAPGQGTKIIVELPRRVSTAALPVAVPATPAEAALPRAPQPSAAGRRARVLVVDDHTVVRQGLVGMLGEHAEVEVVGEAAGGEQAIALAQGLHPDVILMDISMPDISGIEATRRIVERLPEIRIIGLSMHDTEDMAAAMFKAGARAYLRKDAQGDLLVSTILQQAAGLPAPRSTTPSPS